MNPVSFVARVTIKNCSVAFMQNEAPGVIAVQEITIHVPLGESNSWRVSAALNEFRSQLMQDTVEVTLEQLPTCDVA